MRLKNKFIWNILTSIWCWWSNIRFKNSERFSTFVNDIDIVSNLTEIKNLVSRLYNCFIWTADGIDQLGDAITPPPQNYKTYLEKPLKDDCDGFHSLVYHCLYNSGIECYLLTVNPAKMNQGHCILVFKLNDRWYVNDYKKVYNGFTNLQDAIDKYNSIYPERYKTEPVAYNGLVKYSYEEGKFYRIDIENIK